jgi:hypothetical protein
MAAPLPVGASQAELDAIWTDLSTAAEAARQAYIKQHWPQYALANLADYLAVQAPPIANGASVVVHSAADANVAGSPGTAVVVGGVLTKVMLTV